MKISKRLLWMNILITLVTMSLLGILLSSIITNHFEKEMRQDMTRFSRFIDEWLTFKGVYFVDAENVQFNDEILSRIDFRNSSLKFALRIESGGQTYQYYKSKGDVDIFKEYPHGEIIRTTITDEEYLVLSEVKTYTVFDESIEIEVIIYGSNNQRKEVIDQIMMMIMIAIIGIGLVSFLLTHFYDRRLIKPMNHLIASTKQIGLKNYDEIIPVRTGDEYEILSDAILEMSDQLKHNDQEQREFYENISHEVKTPLAVISGYAQSMQSGLIENYEEPLEIIVKNCEKMKHLLEDTIFLSRLDSVENPYEMHRQNINITLGDILNDYESLLLAIGIDIIYEPIQSINVCYDEDKIRRVFSNIISNCMRYASGQIEVLLTASSEVHITISDDGPGFNETILEDPYSRMDRGCSDGNGIGLSIVKKVIEDHKGRLELSNSNGAVYHIILPIN